ncbi:hypothetical protein Lser_V15G04319 [Lactuca serriola]
MAISPSMLPAVLLFYLSIICNSMAVIPQSSRTGGDARRHLIDEIREAELKVVRLESVLVESNSIVDSKDLYVKKSEKMIEEMSSEVDHLQSVLLAMKNDSSSANERFTRLEEEVRLLWDTSRRNNFELHNLESKAQDAEKRVKVTKSRVEKNNGFIFNILNRLLKFHRKRRECPYIMTQRQIQEVKRNATRCYFLKFAKSQLGSLVDDLGRMMGRSWSAVKQYHHQLQRFVKNEMQKWKYTAAYANKEVVFFLASALITFPALSFGVFLLNNFC